MPPDDGYHFLSPLASDLRGDSCGVVSIRLELRDQRGENWIPLRAGPRRVSAAGIGSQFYFGLVQYYFLQ